MTGTAMTGTAMTGTACAAVCCTYRARSSRSPKRAKIRYAAPVRRSLDRGVSAIEAMNLLSITALVALVAMVGVSQYIRSTKTAEAIGGVTTLGQNAVSYFNTTDENQPAGTAPETAHAMRHFPQTAKQSVPADLSALHASRYQSHPSEWATAPWTDLKFSMSQPQSYSYRFEATGAGKSAHAICEAHGDLDGDSIASTFTLSVGPDEKLDAKAAVTVDIREGNE
jgi:hypothetical protein